MGIAGGDRNVGKPGSGRASLATLFSFYLFDHSLQMVRYNLSDRLK